VKHSKHSAEEPARPLTAHEKLRARIGMSPGWLIQLGLEPEAWRDWDREYGPWFRQSHGITLSLTDLERVESQGGPDGEPPFPPGL
jgi:hypothetical protein